MRPVRSTHLPPKRRRKPARKRPDACFTLVEVVVALAILALSLSVVFAAMSNGIGRLSQADSAVTAASLAQSLLARTGVEIPLREGRTDGQFPGGLAWTLSIQPFGDGTDRAQWPLSAYTVTAQVFWDEASIPHSIVLKTIRLGPKEAGR